MLGYEIFHRKILNSSAPVCIILNDLSLRPNVCVTFDRNNIVMQLWWVIYHISLQQETNAVVVCNGANDSDSR